MIQSAVTHDFYLILRGELIVEVSAGGTRDELSAATIDDIVDRVDWKGRAQCADQRRQLPFPELRLSLGETCSTAINVDLSLEEALKLHPSWLSISGLSLALLADGNFTIACIC